MFLNHFVVFRNSLQSFGDCPNTYFTEHLLMTTFAIGLLMQVQYCFWNEQNTLRHNEKVKSPESRR